MFKTEIINGVVYLDYYSGDTHNIHIRRSVDNNSDVNMNFIKKSMIDKANKLKNQNKREINR